MAVLLVAIFAALSFGPASGGLARENANRFDEPALTHAIADPVLAPLARWDSVWYLTIADSGYEGSKARAAFFPLYPLLVRAVGTLFGGSHAALLVAAFLVSLAAFLAALVLLYRLAELELGRSLARPVLLLLALFPAAVYFGAPYSESLFLLLAVGAFYAARTGSWAWAGACAGLASATRSAGLLLVIPLAMIWWGTRPRRASDAAWLLLAPLGIAAYAAWLGLAEGDALRFLDVQEAWSRHLAVPLAGAWDGLVAAWGRRSPARVRLAHAGLLRRGGGRPVPDRRHRRDAVRHARVRGRRVRGRVQTAASVVRGMGTRPPACSIRSTGSPQRTSSAPCERLDHAVHPAVDVPAAVEHLQVDERAVDRRHPVRIAADEQRVEGEGLAHPRVLEVARDVGGQRPQRIEPDHVRDEPEEVPQRPKSRRPAPRIARS